MNQLRDFLRSSDLFAGVRRVRKLMRLGEQYLAPLGFFNPAPVDAEGQPQPWFTYPCITYLHQVLRKEWKVFEYGCGNSTLFWGRHCAQVVSVEHDPRWFNQVKSAQPALDIRLVPEGAETTRPGVASLVASFASMGFRLPLSGDPAHDRMHGLLNAEYADYASQLADFPKGHFDLIVVDGMARSLCLYLAGQQVAEDGLIILDNSDRWQYDDAQRHLVRDRGFHRIDFTGPGPVNPWAWTTSLFFRSPAFLEGVVPPRGAGAGDLGW